MGLLLIYLFAIGLSSAKAQDTLLITGTVYDSTLDRPITYANIGIANKGIGTVSNSAGFFELAVPSMRKKDSLTFSRIGYWTKKYPIKKWLTQKNNEIILSPRRMQLNEVEVVSNKLKVKTKGNKSRSSIAVVVFQTSTLGHEAGIVVRLPDKPVFIKDFNFHVLSVRPDSVKLRLNIYRYNQGIQESLLTNNIYFTVPYGTKGDFKVDLNKYRIVVRNDIFVALETVGVYLSKDPNPNKKNDHYFYDRLTVSASMLGPKLFIRKTSQDKWHKIEGIGMASLGYWLTVAY